MPTKPLLESQVKLAIDQTRSAAQAARYLRVSFNTFKKYASMYSLFDSCKNQSGKGMRKATSKDAPLDDILNGLHPNYNPIKLKHRLINECLLDESCNNCQFNERRVSDYSIPLVLDFINDDKSDKSLANLRLLCHNCYYLIVGKSGSRAKLPV